MIKSTKLKNFKCFQNETVFPLARINLLTGINGRGKSSFLQSILVLKQSLEAKDTVGKIIFNGSCVNLGTFRDVQNRSTGNDNPIEIEHEITGGKLTLKLTRDENDDTIGSIENGIKETILHEFQKVHYIAADRIGPQEFYLKSTLPRFITVGTKGEFVGNVLFQKKADIVYEKLQIINKDSSNELEIKAGEWLSHILNTENVRLYASNQESTRVISLTFGIGGSQFRPTNIGFGYSYVLPIVISGLIAKEGDILIVENPEAHLHPKAQSNLVDFLSIVASCGVQVFIESHSEHILNGLRVSVKNNKVSNDEIFVLFFQDNKEVPFVKINIDNKGGIDLWPNDFFDQNENDLRILLGF